MTYCVTYILSCITKHSPQYRVLMLGRILGGIATSLLFSAFESWLVAEHFKVQSTLYASIEEQQKIQWLLHCSIVLFFNFLRGFSIPGLHQHCCYQEVIVVTGDVLEGYVQSAGGPNHCPSCDTVCALALMLAYRGGSYNEV